MTAELKRVALGLLLVFMLLGITTGYWSVLRSERLAAREDNPRRVLAEQSIQRGSIVDRNGALLAMTRPTGRQDRVQRVYPDPNVAGAVGYFSFQYGSDGLEAAFDDLLRGDVAGRTVWNDLLDGLLHRQPVGDDLRSTIDLRIQQRLAASMGDRRGAAVVISVPGGAILAMVSRPKFDPNAVERDWDRLTEDRLNSPLLNRVTRGLYQPGGALEVALLAGMLGNGDTLSRPVPQGANPVFVAGLGSRLTSLTCAGPPPDSGVLRLIEAFAWTCPRPFVEALDSTGLSLDGYQELLGQLGLLAAPPLHRIETISGPPPVPLDRSPDPERQAALAAVGQGELTVTPLQMARLTAAIANQGNAPPFHLADAYRSPGESRWRDLSIPLLQPALLRPEVALRMRQAMQFAAENSPLVQQAGYEDLAAQGVTLYGHASIAYSGRQQYASWFLGFIDLPDGTSVVAVVVTEDAQTPDEAAVIAGDAFRAVTAALQQPASDTARQP